VDDGFPDGDDDILEEDLMDDKISSSPSIDEGESWYLLQQYLEKMVARYPMAADDVILWLGMFCGPLSKRKRAGGGSGYSLFIFETLCSC